MSNKPKRNLDQFYYEVVNQLVESTIESAATDSKEYLKGATWPDKKQNIDEINNKFISDILKDDKQRETFFGNETVQKNVRIYMDNLEKVRLRKILLDIVKLSMYVQTAFIGVIIILIVCCYVFDFNIFKEIPYNILVALTDLLKWVICAVTVEILGMLAFMVKSVYKNNI